MYGCIVNPFFIFKFVQIIYITTKSLSKYEKTVCNCLSVNGGMRTV